MACVALMEIQASRSAARVGPKGEPILLLDQDRRRWNQLLIQRGLTALARAERLPAAARSRTRCRRRLRRAMPARGRPDQTDWQRIASLYDELATTMPSPIVELNRAVAYGMAFGPEQGPRGRRAARRQPGAQRVSVSARRARRSAVQVEALR